MPIRPLRVLRIERAQQQVPVNLGGVSDAQKRPLVMVERVVLVRSGAEVRERVPDRIFAVPPEPLLLFLAGHDRSVAEVAYEVSKRPCVHAKSKRLAA